MKVGQGDSIVVTRRTRHLFPQAHIHSPPRKKGPETVFWGTITHFPKWPFLKRVDSSIQSSSQ